MDTFNLLLCLSLLSFYLLQFLFTSNFYVWLCIHPVALVKSLFLWRLNLLCYVLSHKSSLWILNLTWIVWQVSQPIFNSLKIGSLLTNNVALAAQATKALNIELWKKEHLRPVQYSDADKFSRSAWKIHQTDLVAVK